jgi:hypothetical protein
MCMPNPINIVTVAAILIPNTIINPIIIVVIITRPQIADTSTSDFVRTASQKKLRAVRSGAYISG